MVGTELRFQNFLDLVEEINHPKVNLSFIIYISSISRFKDPLKDTKTAKILYIFEKLFQKLLEVADGPKCSLQQYYIFE